MPAMPKKDKDDIKKCRTRIAAYEAALQAGCDIDTHNIKVATQRGARYATIC